MQREEERSKIAHKMIDREKIVYREEQEWAAAATDLTSACRPRDALSVDPAPSDVISRDAPFP